MGGVVALFQRRRRAVAPAPLADGPAAQLADDLADDAAAVAALDLDLSAPVVVRHVLLVNDPAAAEALAAAVRESGYDVRIDTHDGGWTWIVTATETALLTAAHAAAARAALTSLAAAHGAGYEGWEPATPS